MIAGFASVLGKQARGTVLLEATQQTKHLTPLQADQHTGVSNTQTTRLNPQQHLKPAELLLAHRQHRQGAPPGTPEPGGVSPLSCRGVSSLYCAYTGCARISSLWKLKQPDHAFHYPRTYRPLILNSSMNFKTALPALLLASSPRRSCQVLAHPTC